LRGEAEVTAAGVLPNPSASLQHQRTFSGPTDQETVAGLSVPLGIGGRRFVLRDAAASRREQARADADATLFESAMAFREAYLTALVDRARVEVLADQQAVLDELSAAIQGLTTGGEAAGYDLARHRTQSSLHRRALELAKARAEASRSRLEAWTGAEVVLPSRSEAPGLAAVPQGPRSPAPSTTDPPRVRSLEAASKASAFDARAARRRWVPDVDLFAGYRQINVGAETGQGISVSLTVPLTFFDHGQGEAAKADADHAIAAAETGRLRRHYRAELKAARAELEMLAASVADARQASSDAALLQTKARQLYAAGEATITELLEAFRAAESARLAELDLAEKIARARLSVMRASGTMFDDALDKACSDTRRGSR
jgi:outer membrane protein TolC